MPPPQHRPRALAPRPPFRQKGINAHPDAPRPQESSRTYGFGGTGTARALQGHVRGTIQLSRRKARRFALRRTGTPHERLWVAARHSSRLWKPPSSNAANPPLTAPRAQLLQAPQGADGKLPARYRRSALDLLKTPPQRRQKQEGYRESTTLRVRAGGTLRAANAGRSARSTLAEIFSHISARKIFDSKGL